VKKASLANLGDLASLEEREWWDRKESKGYQGLMA
jgi:hypothetical protein